MIPLPLPAFIPRYLPPQAPDEWFGHLAFAHDLVAALRPSLLVQLGTVSGDSYFGFCQSIVEQGLDCVCYGVLPSDEPSSQLKLYNATHYGAFSYLLDRGDSGRRFSNDSIDLLHLCTAEYQIETWLPKVRPGGFVLIDGIANRDAENDAWWRVWEQVESTSPEQFAFHHSGGLGVLRKPGGPPLISPLLQSVMTGSQEVREYVRRHYVIYNGYLDRILHINGATQALNTRIEELTTELRAAQHERMFLETELKQTQFERNDARRTIDDVQTSLAAIQAASEAGKARESQIQEETQRLTELLQSEREVIKALMGSLSWKLTAPLRTVMETLRAHKKP